MDDGNAVASDEASPLCYVQVYVTLTALGEAQIGKQTVSADAETDLCEREHFIVRTVPVQRH